MAHTKADRELLRRCFAHEPGAWNDFVDRFLGLIYHVIHHTAHLRSTPLRPEESEGLAAEILSQLLADDYAILRPFRGQSSLAAYLTVLARRTCVHELALRNTALRLDRPVGMDTPKRPLTLNELSPSTRPGHEHHLPAVGTPRARGGR